MGLTEVFLINERVIWTYKGVAAEYDKAIRLLKINFILKIMKVVMWKTMFAQRGNLES